MFKQTLLTLKYFVMNTLDAKKFTLASGLTGVIVYFSCFILMAVLPRETLIKLGNLLFHGLDFSQDIRMDIPFTETLTGLFASFIVWGIIGFIFVTLYNKVKSTN